MHEQKNALAIFTVILEIKLQNGLTVILKNILQCSINNADLVIHPPESSVRWSSIAPLRILSFDIECTNREGWKIFISISKNSMLGALIYKDQVL